MAETLEFFKYIDMGVKLKAGQAKFKYTYVNIYRVILNLHYSI